ncbi:MAG: hypothetical protein ACMUIP_11620 [bacterium]
MKIIAFITQEKIIRKILEHLDLWRDKPSRDPPTCLKVPPLYTNHYMMIPRATMILNLE